MKRLILCLAAALLSSCATSPAGPPPPPPPPAPPPPPPPPPPPGVAGQAGESCPLTIVFASYAMGIDGPTRTRVEALLAGDRAVTGFQSIPWGREGETTLCVRTRAPADASRLFQAIRALVPPNPRGPVTIRTREGLSFEAPPGR